ncbi:hypothetical protein [Streptomyces sp. MS2.AVA.5]|uniref:Uncharacterized protein n=1 Tax=Streptomyces achmelvichensis TaxID=3134111 RepID=A0ACC6PKH6_9ACTN
MASEHPRPNTQLRAVRELDLQMSRTEFARLIIATGADMGEHVGCTARLVAAWEDGDVDCPRAVYRRILSRLTGRAMSELGFRLPSLPTGRAGERSTTERTLQDRSIIQVAAWCCARAPAPRWL